MNINPSWKYSEVMENLRTLRTQYKEILTSFSYTRERNEFMRKVKNQIYSLKFCESRKDEIWNEMNRIGELELYEEDFELDDRLL